MCSAEIWIPDAPGASPRCWGALVAIVLEYKDVSINVMPGTRPHPRRGLGWRRGDLMFF
jgi:hypothetical protein